MYSKNSIEHLEGELEKIKIEIRQLLEIEDFFENRLKELENSCKHWKFRVFNPFVHNTLQSTLETLKEIRRKHAELIRRKHELEDILEKLE